MSKLISRIEKISRGSPAPMGFGASARAARTPTMAIVGILPRNNLRGARRLAVLDADGAILGSVGTDKKLASITDALGSVPWGVQTDDLDDKAANALVKKGCDFFLVNPDGATVEATKDDRAAFLLSLPTDASDAFLRALEDLPISAAFVSLDADGPLTLRHLIQIGSLRAMFDKYLLVEVPVAVSSKELEALRDVGVDAIVVNPENSTQAKLKAMKQRLVELPRQRKPRSERANALIPAGLSDRAHQDDHDHDDD